MAKVLLVGNVEACLPSLSLPGEKSAVRRVGNRQNGLVGSGYAMFKKLSREGDIKGMVVQKGKKRANLSPGVWHAMYRCVLEIGSPAKSP